MLISHSNCQIHVFCRILATTEYLGGGVFYNGLDTLLMALWATLYISHSSAERMFHTNVSELYKAWMNNKAI